MLRIQKSANGAFFIARVLRQPHTLSRQRCLYWIRVSIPYKNGGIINDKNHLLDFGRRILCIGNSDAGFHLLGFQSACPNRQPCVAAFTQPVFLA